MLCERVASHMNINLNICVCQTVVCMCVCVCVSVAETLCVCESVEFEKVLICSVCMYHAEHMGSTMAVPCAHTSIVQCQVFDLSEFCACKLPLAWQYRRAV